MSEEFGGLTLSDAALDQILPFVAIYLEQARQLRLLDLSTVLPARLLRVDEGRRGS